jgi:hypothetical protein
VQSSVTDIIRCMFTGGSTSVLADYLEEQGHPNACVVRAMTNPTEIVRLLAGDLIQPSVIFELPITELDKLDIALRHAAIEDSVLFELACDFAEHILPIYERWNEFDHRPRNALDTMREWIRGSAKDDALMQARAAIKLRRPPPAAGRAVSAVLIATNPWAWATHCVAGDNAFDSAAAAREAAGPDEIHWQIERASQRLTPIRNAR